MYVIWGINIFDVAASRDALLHFIKGSVRGIVNKISPIRTSHILIIRPKEFVAVHFAEYGVVAHGFTILIEAAVPEPSPFRSWIASVSDYTFEIRYAPIVAQLALD